MRRYEKAADNYHVFS